jgi:hypothetical protein
MSTEVVQLDKNLTTNCCPTRSLETIAHSKNFMCDIGGCLNREYSESSETRKMRRTFSKRPF